MNRLYIAVVLPLSLAACDASFQGKKEGNVVAATGAVDDHQVTIDTPEFKASMKLPAMSFVEGNSDIDGMKLYPNSKITGINVNGAENKVDSSVKLGFASPDAPSKLAAYYEKAARDAGFTVALASASGLSGSKPGGKAFAITMAPDGTGTKGELTISGE